MISDDIDLQEAVLDTALIFLFWGEDTPKTFEMFADEHLLGEQRFFNMLCWAYGYNPRSSVGQDAGFFLPESRRVRCTDEWDKLDRGMRNLLKPHIRQ